MQHLDHQQQRSTPRSRAQQQRQPAEEFDQPGHLGPEDARRDPRLLEELGRAFNAGATIGDLAM